MYARAAVYRIGLCSVLHPRQHSIGYMGDVVVAMGDQRQGRPLYHNLTQ